MHDSARNRAQWSTRRSSTVENKISAVLLMRVDIRRSYMSYDMPRVHDYDVKHVQVLGTERLSSDRLFGGLNGRASRAALRIASSDPSLTYIYILNE
jgi:hypothetical protein